MNRTEAKVGQASRLPYERAIDSGNANLPLPSPAQASRPPSPGPQLGYSANTMCFQEIAWATRTCRHAHRVYKRSRKVL